MFPSLQNKFSNYRACLLRIAFAQLCFHTLAITALRYSIPEEPLMFLNVSPLLRPVLFLEVSTQQGPQLHLNCLIHRDQCLLNVCSAQPKKNGSTWLDPQHCQMFNLSRTSIIYMQSSLLFPDTQTGLTQYDCGHKKPLLCLKQ